MFIHPCLAFPAEATIKAIDHISLHPSASRQIQVLPHVVLGNLRTSWFSGIIRANFFMAVGS
jgi:hypothetical protein